MQTKRVFWVTNLTDCDIGLTDLRVTVPAFKSVNLLDSRHYHLTLDQLEKSAESGSIKKRKGKIVIRNEPVKQYIAKPGMQVYKGPVIRRNERTIIDIKVPEYEELNILKNDDESFAKDNSDLMEEFNKPILPVRK